MVVAVVVTTNLAGLTAAEATLRRDETRERFSVPRDTSNPVRPDQPPGRPTWLLASLGALALGVALAGGLAVLVARRTGRARTRQAT